MRDSNSSSFPAHFPLKYRLLLLKRNLQNYFGISLHLTFCYSPHSECLQTVEKDLRLKLTGDRWNLSGSRNLCWISARIKPIKINQCLWSKRKKRNLWTLTNVKHSLIFKCTETLNPACDEDYRRVSWRDLTLWSALYVFTDGCNVFTCSYKTNLWNKRYSCSFARTPSFTLKPRFSFILTWEGLLSHCVSLYIWGLNFSALTSSQLKRSWFLQTGLWFWDGERCSPCAPGVGVSRPEPPSAAAPSPRSWPRWRCWRCAKQTTKLREIL